MLLIRLFHDGMTGQVLSNGNVTDTFVISNGVKKGCVLALVLFNVFFTCMLSHAVQDLEKGVCICYRLDGSLFDRRRFTANTKSLQRGSLRRKLCTNVPRRIRPATDAGPLLRSIQALQQNNQSRKDGGAPPTCTILPLPTPSPLTTNHLPT